MPSLALPSLNYFIKAYIDGELVHSKLIEETDFVNSSEGELEIDEAISKYYRMKNIEVSAIEVIQKEFLGYQVRVYGEEGLTEVLVVTVEPLLEFSGKYFKAEQVIVEEEFK